MSGAGFIQVVGTHYYATSTASLLTQANAMAHAASYGGHLAAITSAAENEAVLAVASATDPDGLFWLGGGDQVVEGSFQWFTGESFSYSNFALGEPDDDAGIGGGADALVMMTSNGTWIDTNANFVGFVDGPLVVEFDSYLDFNLLGEGTGLSEMRGSSGNDTLRHVLGGQTAMLASGGNDTLYGGTIAGVTYNGGQGTDIVTFQTVTSAVTVDLRDADGSSNAGLALNCVFTSIETFRLTSRADTFIGSDAAAAVNRAYGYGGIDHFVAGGTGTTNIFYGALGGDLFTGSAGRMQAYGQDGNDSFDGGTGVDIIDGGIGTDTLKGRSGADRMTGGADGDDFVFFAADTGFDVVLDYELGVDHITMTGIADANLRLSLTSTGEAIISILSSGAKIKFVGVGDLAQLHDDVVFL